MLNPLQEYFNTIKENSFTEYSELDATNTAEARKDFFENSTLRVPRFQYERPEQTPEHLRGILENLDRVRSEILRDESLKGSEKKLLYQLIQAARKKIALLLAASEYRRGINPENNAAKFACSTKNKYGEPDRNLTLALLNQELRQIQSKKFTNDDQQIYQRLLVNLPEREDATASLFTPRPEIMAEFGKLFRQHFPLFFEYVPEDKAEFTPEEVADIANRVIAQLQTWSDTKFRVEISDTKSNLSVDQLERILYIPRYRTLGPYTREVVLTKICAHEFVHVFRGIPYEKCGVPVLSYGFPGYGEAEEGITTACEYAIRGGEYIPPNRNHYVNIGLLYHFGNKGYDFRRVFEIRRDLIYLSKVNPHSDKATKDKCYKQAMEQAFTELSRATRGTGVLIYHKDLVYVNGNQKILQYIEAVIESRNSNAIDQMFDRLFWSGKTDPFDEQQIKIATSAANGEFCGAIKLPGGKFRDQPM